MLNDEQISFLRKELVELANPSNAGNPLFL